MIDQSMATVQLTGWSREQIAATIGALGEPVREGVIPTDAMIRLSITRAQGLAMLRALAESPCRPRRKSLRLDAWRLGDWLMVAVPGELFASLGQHIAAASPLPSIVVGYAGGYTGYLADRAAYSAGTYEALASPLGRVRESEWREAAVALARQFSPTLDR